MMDITSTFEYQKVMYGTGDNLCHSLDSRSYGVVPMGLITGKIVAANSMSEGISTLYNFRWITNTLQDE